MRFYGNPGMSRRVFLITLLSGAIIFCGCRREPGKALHAIYTGNLQGYLEPCPCPEGRVGGLSRQARASEDSLRSWGGAALILDAGVFAEPHDLPGDLKNRAILEAFAKMKYDAVNVSASDLIAGVEILRWAADSLNLPLISANLAYKKTSETVFPSWIIKEKNGKEIGIIGAGEVRPVDLKRAGIENLEFLDPETAIENVVAEIRSECDIIIVLCDFPARLARQLGVKISGIDVIISSRDLFPKTQLNRSGSAYVLGVSRKGTRMTTLDLVITADDSLTCWFHSKLLDDDVKGHPTIDRIVKAYKDSRRSAAFDTLSSE